MRVFVVGASGFIGSALVGGALPRVPARHALSQQDPVRVGGTHRCIRRGLTAW
jgi:nucleoside-diphosphate-sugar epimerase